MILNNNSKIHKIGLYCGTYRKNACEININGFVTCKKCLRLIADDKPNKLYKVKFEFQEVRYIEAPTPSKAIYRCFKEFVYNDDLCENIGQQFQWFRSDKPKATIVKDESITKSLTYEEKHQLEIDETNKLMNEFNEKYPIGTKVLFQADGKDEAIITTTRSKATNNNGTYLVIWVEATGSSYHLDDRWIRILTDENKNLKRLR